MVIRSATRADLPHVAEIWNDAIRTTTATFTTQEKAPDDLKDRLDRLWVMDDGAVLGFVTYGPFREGPGYLRVCEVSIYLRTQSQGRGMGRELMRTAEQNAARAGHTQMVAAIGGENLAAVQFHASCGFQKVAHMPEIGWKFGRMHDLILMQKKIETPS